MARLHMPEVVTSGGAYYQEERVTYYRGTGHVYEQDAEKPWAGHTDYVTCPHRHPDPETATRCGAQLAARTAKAMNKAAVEAIKDLPCDYRAGDTGTTLHGAQTWIKYCRNHRTAAFGTTLRFSEAEALASDWECPWAQVPR